jgi:hypothetical protein
VPEAVPPVIIPLAGSCKGYNCRNT